MKFLKEAKESFIALKQLDILFPILFDLGFILLYGAITGYYGASVTNTLYSLGNAIMGNQGAGVYFKSLLLSLAGMAGLIFLIYIIFQGFSWRFSRLLFGEEERTIPYLIKFSVLNIPFYLIFLVYFILIFMLNFKKVDNIFIQILSYSILAIILYFAFISYTLIQKKNPIKNALKIGKQRFSYLAPRMLGSFILLAVVYNLVNYSGIFNSDLMIVLGVFIFMPLVTWARVFMHEINKKFI